MKPVIVEETKSFIEGPSDALEAKTLTKDNNLEITIFKTDLRYIVKLGNRTVTVAKKYYGPDGSVKSDTDMAYISNDVDYFLARFYLANGYSSNRQSRRAAKKSKKK